MSKPHLHIPYAELERQTLLDLAARTVTDPDAPHEHVENARATLRNTRRESDVEDVVAELTPAGKTALRHAIAVIRGESTDRRLVHPWQLRCDRCNTSVTPTDDALTSETP